MNAGIDIPSPIRFNAFKHHRNFILELLETASADWVASQLDPLCHNYIDIYTGQMPPGAIAIAVIDLLKSNQAFEPEDFSRWVDSENGYRQINLEDQSEWVVRKGNENERYIHLHPSRIGPHSTRFKGSTLKTVFQLKASLPDLQQTPTLEMVNRVRIQLGLSPVKKLDRHQGILNCYEKFFPQD